MTTTIISSTETGGAGYASKNLLHGLLELGINVQYLSLKTIGKEKSILKKLATKWSVRKNVLNSAKYLQNAPVGYDYFTFSRTGYRNIHNHPYIKNANVINMNWISNMIDYPTFFSNLNKPVIWTLHDTNPFTGGCHYTFGCNNYLDTCFNCPQVANEYRNVVEKNFSIKKNSLQNLQKEKTVVVAPSEWLMRLSQKSALLGAYKHYVIPYSLDTTVFAYHNKNESRKALALPADKFIILFICTNLSEYRKGFDIILKLKEEFKEKKDILFVTVGNNSMEIPGIFSFGYISDATMLSNIYSAADVFIIPSREDNLPNTMIEALCCGTPVIGFNIGGIPDAVEHGSNGYLAEKEDIVSIKHFIGKMMQEQSFDRRKISITAIEKYSYKQQANAYKKIMDEIV